MRKIHIKLIDKDWILEKCAYEIASRAYYINYALDDDPSADLTYYINYHSFSGKKYGKQVAFFTHLEKDEANIKRFFDVARQMDYCICMSNKYADMLIQHKIKNVKVIAPGVDLKTFYPKVHIGVIGRTYASGRKGESLIEQVYDTPGIEWHFTGKGWPGPSRFIPDSQMNDFYNHLDYVLVPSVYEGGPMCVIEGLACGIPIISSDVGWAWDFPHIPFENGNADSLRKVLEGLVAERMKLRSSVESVTWDNWAQQHIELFNNLVPCSSVEEVTELPSVDLILHGNESVSKGGPSGRIVQTKRGLKALGVNITYISEHEDNYSSSSIAHIFNVWPAHTCIQSLKNAKIAGKITVLSSIFLNLTNFYIYNEEIPFIFKKFNGKEDLLNRELKKIASHLDDDNNMPILEPYPGYYDAVRQCAKLADHIIVLSEYEKKCLQYLHIDVQKTSIVRNPVDAKAVVGGDPELFYKQYNIRNFILCVGRIEPRKNQLMVAYAARLFNIPVVFLGHEGSAEYASLVRQYGGNNVVFIPRIEHSSPMFAAIYAAAGAFCLPSWSEGASLAALEAGAAGLPLVLSDRGSEQEYFGRYAEYVNPADVTAIGYAMKKALHKKTDRNYTESLSNFTISNYSEEKYAEDTLNAYKRIFFNINKKNICDSQRIKYIFFDITTSIHHTGNPTGIARVEHNLLQAMINEYGLSIIPVCWNSESKNYCILSQQQALSFPKLYEINEWEETGQIDSVKMTAEAKDSVLFVGGSAWMRNSEYIDNIKKFKMMTGCKIGFLIHDLIEINFKYLYNKKDTDIFSYNLYQMCLNTDFFLGFSLATRNDIKKYLLSKSLPYKEILPCKQMEVINTSIDEISIASLLNKKYILFVSSFNPRKNHNLMLNIWRRMVENGRKDIPQLVFVGRETDYYQVIKKIVDFDIHIKPYIQFLTNIGDAELKWIYKHSLFTCYPSIFEGYGLPVSESLQFGKFCLTSSHSATEEIAPNFTECIDPYDFREWYDKITYYIDNYNVIKEKEAYICKYYTPKSSKESAESFFNAIKSGHYSTLYFENSFKNGDIIYFNDKNTINNIALYGWHSREDWGMWQSLPLAYCAFRVNKEVKYIKLDINVFLASSFDVRINGINTGKYYCESSEVIDILLPESTEDSQIIVVDFHCTINSPQKLNIGNDNRLLGIGIKKIIFTNKVENITIHKKEIHDNNN